MTVFRFLGKLREGGSQGVEEHERRETLLRLGHLFEEVAEGGSEVKRRSEATKAELAELAR